MSISAWLAHLALASLALFLLAMIAAIVLRLVRRDPLVAYRAARIALVLALALVPLEALVVTGVLNLETRSAPLTALGERVRALESRDTPPLTDAISLVSTPVAPAPERASPNAPPVSTQVVQEPVEAQRVHGPRASPPQDLAEFTGAIAEPATSATLGARAFSIDRRVSLAIGAIYLLGFGFALRSALRRWARTRAFVSRCQVADAAVLGPTISAAREYTTLRRFDVLVSDEIHSPCCVGVFRRAVVLPRGDAEPGTDSHRVLLAMVHELVHLEQRDPVTQAAQRALSTLFWFHPAAYWLSHVLDDLREIACDRTVVDRTGRSKSYARALLQYAAAPTTLTAVHDATAMLDWNRRRSLLRRRIEMLTCTRRNTTKSKKLMLAAVSGSTLAALIALQLAAASALPAFASESETLVAFCPPKETPAAPCGPIDSPRPGEGKSDRKAPRKDLKSPKNAPASPEERNQRLRELLANKRGERGDPLMTLITAGGAQSDTEVAMDPDVKKALIRTLLRDDHSTARSTAAAALAPFIKEKEIKDAFMTALRDGRDSRLKITVLDELLKREALSDDARELFVRLFAMDNTEYQRISLTEALAPYANEPDARDALVEALMDDQNEPMQVEAALALSPQAGDSAVQSAMTRLLRHSGNEVARLIIIDALSPHAASSEEVRKLFVEVLVKDDSAIARVRVADRLVENSVDPNVRKVMLDSLSTGVSVLIQNRLVEGLAAHVHEPDVKRGFIALLERVNDEVVKLRLVSSLADVAVQGARPAAAESGNRTWMGDATDPGHLVPVVLPKY